MTLHLRSEDVIDHSPFTRRFTFHCESVSLPSNGHVAQRRYANAIIRRTCAPEATAVVVQGVGTHFHSCPVSRSQTTTHPDLESSNSPAQ